MPQTISLYKLFLASPSDVKAERKIVENVIDEFNNLYTAKLNAKIELCSWEKSTYPSIGEYSQAVINSQIGQEYDIFLGILWTRFGSKTLNYDSGTEEEFYCALERTKKADKVHIMMYFNIEGLPLDSLDIEQFSKVRAFRNKIEEYGCYYFTYVGSEAFKNDLRSHLYKVIENWDVIKMSSIDSPNSTTLPMTASSTEDEINELGLLEFQDILDAKSVEAIKALGEISSSTSWIGAQISEQTEKLNGINGISSTVKTQLTRNVINSSAKVMNQYAIRIEQPIQNWITSYQEIVEAFKGLLKVSDNIIHEDSWIENKEALFSLINSVDSSYGQIVEFYQSVKNLPRLTQGIILAKKNVCSKLEQFIDSMDKCKDLANEMIELIDKKLCNIDQLEA